MAEVPDAAWLGDLHDMTWWMNSDTCIGMGAERQFDYTGEGTLGSDLTPRLGDCYRLAAQAFYGWDKMLDVMRATNSMPSPQTPMPTMLVHGFWKHPDEAIGITHAWVMLADGRVWEPITGLICDATLFYAFSGAIDISTYTGTEVRVNMLRHGHYGPWY